ncbi:MAG: carboxy terminal-processing peptidase [Planctomycetia bacterium]|nr:carboxy terminal-processing peptidase [Planctomycetia bacterium]
MNINSMNRSRLTCLFGATLFFALISGAFLSNPSDPWCLLQSASAEVTEPSSRDESIAITVGALMKREHISERAFDATMAERTLTNMLKGLDPQKLYFYQSDYDYIMSQKAQLPEMMQSGNLRLAFVIYKTYLARVDERSAMMVEALNQPIDFTIDEEMTTEPDLLSYPKNSTEARERVRKRVKYDLLVLMMDDLRDEKKGDAETPKDENSAEAAPATPPKTKEEKHKESVEKLQKRYTSFAKRMHQINNDELLEMYLTAMTMAYDPHSTYMSPSTVENFEIQMKLELDGIGATLSSEDGYVIVRHLVPGGAADKEGSLKVDDKISGVGQGADGAIEDVVDMKLDDVVKKIRGKQGTIVRLEVLPAAGGPKKIVQITRSKIELRDSEAKGEILEVGKKPDGKPYRVGAINLPSFYMDMRGAQIGFGEYKSSTKDVQRILENFNQNQVDAVVLDLRMNGGGSLVEAIRLTGLFIDLGPVVQVKGAEERPSTHSDVEPGVAWEGPLVVVINKLSASASEILAGAIQDYNRGLIVGDATTHGKGTVQTVVDLGRMLFRSSSTLKFGSLKVTIQQFYRPLGDSTQNHGVKSDIEIPSITTHMDIGESDLDYAMPFDKIEPKSIRKWAGATPETISALRARSTERVAASSDFQKLVKKIDFYKEQKGRKSVTLNAEKFLAERADMIEEENENLQEAGMRSANDIKRDFYLEEVLNITIDFLNAM